MKKAKQLLSLVLALCMLLALGPVMALPASAAADTAIYSTDTIPALTTNGQLANTLLNDTENAVFTTDGTITGSVANDYYKYLNSQLSYTGVTLAEVQAYETALTEAGWTANGQGSTIGSNYFATWTKDAVMVHLSYFGALDDGRLQIVWGSAAYLLPSSIGETSADVCTPSVTLLQRTGAALCIVVQLADGSFIVVDGGFGYNTPTTDIAEENLLDSTAENPSAAYDYATEIETLLSFLEAKMPDSHDLPQVTWITTHAHTDHVQQLRKIMITSSYSARFSLNNVIYNFPNPEQIGMAADSQYVEDTWADMYRHWDGTESANHYIWHTGDTLTLPGATLEVLYTPEDFQPHYDETTEEDTLNHTCSVFRLTFSNGKSLLITGDAWTNEAADMVTAYGDYLKSDILQVTHHGVEGGNLSFYQAVAPSVCLWPITDYYYNYDARLGADSTHANAYDYNIWLRSNVATHYTASETHTLPMSQTKELTLIGAEMPNGLPVNATADYLSDYFDTTVSNGVTVEYTGNNNDKADMVNNGTNTATYAYHYNDLLGTTERLALTTTKRLAFNSDGTADTYVRPYIYLGYYGTLYEKGLGVHPSAGGSADRYITFKVNAEGAPSGERFYAVVGGNANNITDPKATVSVDFELWGSSGDTPENFQLIACAREIYSYYTAEFDVDVSDYTYLRLVTRMSDAAMSHSACAVSWGNACLYTTSDYTATAGYTAYTEDEYDNAGANANFAYPTVYCGASTDLSDEAYLVSSYVQPAGGSTTARTAGIDREFSQTTAGSISVGKTGGAASFANYISMLVSSATNPNAYAIMDVSTIPGDRFYSRVGIYGSAKSATDRGAIFRVWGSKSDDASEDAYVLLASSGALYGYTIGEFDLDIAGYHYLKLEVALPEGQTSISGCNVAFLAPRVYDTKAHHTYEGAVCAECGVTYQSATSGYDFYYTNISSAISYPTIYTDCNSPVDLSDSAYLVSSYVQPGSSGTDRTAGIDMKFNGTEAASIGVSYANTTYSDYISMLLSGSSYEDAYAIMDVSGIAGNRFTTKVGIYGGNSSTLTGRYELTGKYKVVFRIWGSTTDADAGYDWQLLECSDPIYAHGIGLFDTDITGYNYLKLEVIRPQGQTANSGCEVAFIEPTVYTELAAHSWDADDYCSVCGIDKFAQTDNVTLFPATADTTEAAEYQGVSADMQSTDLANADYLVDSWVLANGTYPDGRPAGINYVSTSYPTTTATTVKAGNPSVTYSAYIDLHVSTAQATYAVLDITGLEGDRFHSIVGMTNTATQKDTTRARAVFTLYGSTAETYSADAEFVLLACSSTIMGYNTAEFDVDVSGYNFLKLEADLPRDYSTISGGNSTWLNPVLYGEKTVVPVNPSIASASLVLGSVLDLNITVDPGNTGTAYTLQAAIGSDDLSTVDFANGVFTIKLPAHRLYEGVTLNLLSGGNIVDTETWTMEAYSAAIRKESAENTKLLSLLGTLEQYGKFADYFADPANTAQPDTSSIAGVKRSDLNGFKCSIPVINSSLGAVAGLYLDDACDLTVKFNAAAWGEGYQLLVNGTAVETTAADGKICYTKPGLMPQEWSDIYSFKVVDGEGNTVFAVNYCVLSYAYTCLGKTQELQEGLNDLLKAMYLYNAAATAYIAG